MNSLRTKINKTYVIIISVYGIILNAYYLTFKEFALSKWYISIILTLVVPILILIFPIDKFLQKTIPRFASSALGSDKWILGKYNILIEYSESGVTRKRSGLVEINTSLNGLSMIGGKLVDTDMANAVTMESWRSDDVFLYNYPGYCLLMYIYKTNEGTGEPNRQGYVTCAFKTSEREKGIIGDFWDFEGQVVNRRKGTVRLVPIS